MEQRAYGAYRDTPDSRDTAFAHVGIPVGDITHISGDNVDLEPWLGPVKNQRALGACTGFAAAGLREFLARRYSSLETKQDVDHQRLILSPLFVYWWNRRNDGKLDYGDDNRYIGVDRGASIRSSMRTLRWQGVCTEKEDPYEPAQFRARPEVSDCEEALLFRTGAYHALTSLQDMKDCLHSGYAFVAAIDVYESFESSEVMNTGEVPVPKAGEPFLGGHAILVCGDEVDKRRFKVRNSWGAAWGDHGNFYLPYEFFEAGHMNSMWMAHLGKAW
jgi:hypothetical protein